MNNVLIFNNNLEIVKKVCNILFNNFDNIRLIKIVSSAEEFLNACTTSKFNIIFISNSDLQSEKIQNHIKNIQTKIVLCDQLSKNKNSKYTFYLPLNTNESYFQAQLSCFLSKINQKNASMKIHKILQDSNFDFKLKGTNYLLESILYSYLHKEEYLFENLEKNIYPHVAEVYHVESHTIKWAIIRAINNMNSHIKSSDLKDFYTGFGEKITPKLLIYDIVNRL